MFRTWCRFFRGGLQGDLLVRVTFSPFRNVYARRKVHFLVRGHVRGVVSQAFPLGPIETGYLASSSLSAPPSGGVPGSGGRSKSNVSGPNLPRVTTRVPLWRSRVRMISSFSLLRNEMSLVTIRLEPGTPVSNEYTSAPTLLRAGHADSPCAINSASEALQTGTARQLKRAPCGSCMWMCCTGGGFAERSLALKNSSWKMRPDGAPGFLVVNASRYSTLAVGSAAAL